MPCNKFFTLIFCDLFDAILILQNAAEIGISRVMENTAHLLKNLEDASFGLGNSFARAGLNGYMASAIFVASKESQGSVFALTHSGGTPEHFARTDKHVYLRRFSSERSIAAQVFGENEASAHRSKMFPNEHLCVNVPITASQRPDHDIHSRGMLQVVFAPGTQTDLGNVQSHIQSQPSYQALSGILVPLLDGVDDGRDSFFKVRDPYAANSVVMFFDIADFTGHSNRLGHYRAQDFADKFCQDFMKPISEEYGANLLRYEGDGLWLEMPLDPYDKDEERKDKINQAIEMAEHVIGEFSDFAQDQDYGFQDAKLKASLELGEVRDYYWDRHQSLITKPNDRSGPVFSHLRKADHMVARRDRNDIVLGPELRAELNNGNIYDIKPDDFEHY